VALQPGDDPHGVDEHLAVVGLEHRDEVLAAELAHGATVGRVDVDPFDGDALVPEGQRDALDVRGEGDPQDAHGGGHDG
jgi:hypothetical protein